MVYPHCIIYRATLVDQGQKHPVESWDFEQGDVWCAAAPMNSC